MFKLSFQVSQKKITKKNWLSNWLPLIEIEPSYDSLGVLNNIAHHEMAKSILPVLQVEHFLKQTLILPNLDPELRRLAIGIFALICDADRVNEIAIDNSYVSELYSTLRSILEGTEKHMALYGVLLPISNLATSDSNKLLFAKESFIPTLFQILKIESSPFSNVMVHLPVAKKEALKVQ